MDSIKSELQPGVGHPTHLDIDEVVSLQLVQLGDTERRYVMIDGDREHLSVNQRWAGTATPESTQRAVEDVVRKTQEGTWLQYLIMVADPDSDEPVPAGIVTLYDRDAETGIVNLGYWVTEAYEGQGIAGRAAERLVRYAFDEWGVQQIVLEIEDSNDRSQRLAARLGAHSTEEFRYEKIGEETVARRLWVIEKP